MKTCTKCKETKALSAFSAAKDKRDGLNCHCKACNKVARDGKKPEISAYKKVYAQKNKQRLAASRRLRAYGTDGIEMYSQQMGECAICNADLEALPLRHRHIDHCHKTGKVRAWLCHFCNVLLAHAKEDRRILSKAAAYLRMHETGTFSHHKAVGRRVSK